MITGAKIHEARELLGWSRDRLAPKAGMCTNNLRRLEIGAKPVSEPEAAALSSALEAAGVASRRPRAGREAEALRPSGRSPISTLKTMVEGDRCSNAGARLTRITAAMAPSAAASEVVVCNGHRNRHDRTSLCSERVYADGLVNVLEVLKPEIVEVQRKGLPNEIVGHARDADAAGFGQRL